VARPDTATKKRTLHPATRQRLPAHTLWAGLLALAFLLVLAVYGRSLTLPFFADDFAHIAYMASHSIGELWRTIEGVGYYRPLTFTVWELTVPLTGWHSPLLQHAINLLLHLGNGLLVAWLAGRLWADGHEEQTGVWLLRFLSATLFLLYPFSYQAVPWVGALPHLLVTFLVLSAVATYILGQERGRGWLALSLGCTVLALATHENGAIIPALIVGYELSRPQRLPLSHITRRVLLWTLPVIAWLPLYFTISSTAGNHLSPNLNQVLQNTLYAVQGISYPLTWLGGLIVRQTGQNPFLVAALLGLPLLIVATSYLWRVTSPRWRLHALFPLAWWALAVLPMILFLDSSYVLAGPRLLMLSSAGIAWFWAAVATHLLTPQGSAPTAGHRWRAVLSLLALGMVLVHSLTFLHARMNDHALVGRAIHQAVSWSQTANSAGRTAVFVNFPHWIAPDETTYALGTEGVVAVPQDALPPYVISAHTGRPAQVRLLNYADIRTDLPYHFNPAGAGTDWPAFVAERALLVLTDYGPRDIRLQPIGGFQAAAPFTPSQATFTTPKGTIDLLSATASREENGIRVHLLWQATTKPQLDVTVFVHAVDGAGQIVAQADAYPVGGTYPFIAFEPEQVVEDIRLITDGGQATAVRLGLYRRDNGQRLPALQDGIALPDDSLQIPLAPPTSKQ
jgi:hypothetical protein